MNVCVLILAKYSVPEYAFHCLDDVALQWIGSSSRVYPASWPKSAGIATPKGTKLMDGWMDTYSKLFPANLTSLYKANQIIFFVFILNTNVA